jgi:calcineurin-like phosphoesterase family protein
VSVPISPSLGALGDIHKDWGSVRAIMARHPDVPAWLCVGDLGDDDGVYEEVPAPIYWIKGNNESFDAVTSGALPHNLCHIPNGTATEIAGVTVGGLGGTFAPTWYDTDPASLPHPRKGTMKATALADKRRHFVRQEVQALQRVGRVDVLLTHEAPRPFPVGRVDAGKTPINELIAALRPRLHLFGHHHRFSEQDVQSTRSICLDLVGRSYLLIDTGTWDYERRDLERVRA